MKKMYVIIPLFVLLLLVVVTLFVINSVYQSNKLFMAIEKDNYALVQQAIDSGAWIDKPKYLLNISNLVPTNPTPLIAACKNGNQEIVRLLIESGADINKKDSYTGKTPLLAALHGSKSNRFTLAMYLIENGADIHISQETTSPLEETLVVLDTDSVETVESGFVLFRYLIEHKIDVDISTGNENILTFAAHYNNSNVVDYLICNNICNVNSFDQNGDTALIVAVKNDRTDIVRLLLKLGADVTITDSNNKLAKDYALMNENDLILMYLEDAETVLGDRGT